MAKPGQHTPSYQYSFPTQGQNPFPIPQTGSIPHPHPNMGDWQQKIQDWQGHWNFTPPAHEMPQLPAPQPMPAPQPVPSQGFHYGWNQNHNPHSGLGWNHNFGNPEGQGWNHNGGPNVFHPLNPGASGQG